MFSKIEAQGLEVQRGESGRFCWSTGLAAPPGVGASNQEPNAFPELGTAVSTVPGESFGPVPRPDALGALRLPAAPRHRRGRARAQPALGVLRRAVLLRAEGATQHLGRDL